MWIAGIMVYSVIFHFLFSFIQTRRIRPWDTPVRRGLSCVSAWKEESFFFAGVERRVKREKRSREVAALCHIALWPWPFGCIPAACSVHPTIWQCPRQGKCRRLGCTQTQLHSHTWSSGSAFGFAHTSNLHAAHTPMIHDEPTNIRKRRLVAVDCAS